MNRLWPAVWENESPTNRPCLERIADETPLTGRLKEPIAHPLDRPPLTKSRVCAQGWDAPSEFEGSGRGRSFFFTKNFLLNNVVFFHELLRRHSLWARHVPKSEKEIEIFCPPGRMLDKEYKWNEMKWNEMKWNEMKWNEMKWNEMKWNEVKWNEMKWNEMKWNEMKWNEMKWNEMKWNEMKWKWNEMK